MQEPRNYRITQVGWESVTPGGHKCIIKKVTETRSSGGNEMLIIEFDMHQSDIQPMYFSNLYMSDQKAGKTGDKLKWRGTGYIVTDENTDYGTKNLKAFNTAVEDSNPGFQTVWGDGYCRALENKLVGIVFREEEYTKDDGSLGWSVKPMRYCNFEKAYEQKIPERKNIAQPAIQQAPPQGQWGNVPVNANGYWQPQGQPSTQYGYMQSQQPQFQQQSFQQFQQAAPPNYQAANEGFMQIPPDALNDEGLPFI